MTRFSRARLAALAILAAIVLTKPTMGQQATPAVRRVAIRAAHLVDPASGQRTDDVVLSSKAIASSKSARPVDSGRHRTLDPGRARCCPVPSTCTRTCRLRAGTHHRHVPPKPDRYGGAGADAREAHARGRVHDRARRRRRRIHRCRAARRNQRGLVAGPRMMVATLRSAPPAATAT